MRWGIALLLIALSFAPGAFAMGDKPGKEQHADKNHCIVGGCSGQLCTDARNGGVASTCEWRESYACYSKYGSCKLQPDGQCGWTPTQALTECVGSAQ